MATITRVSNRVRTPSSRNAAADMNPPARHAQLGRGQVQERNRVAGRVPASDGRHLEEGGGGGGDGPLEDEDILGDNGVITLLSNCRYLRPHICS